MWSKWRYQVLSQFILSDAIILTSTHISYLSDIFTDYRGRIMHRTCGVSNAGDGDARVQACIAALPRTVPWNVSDFAYNVNWWQVKIFLKFSDLW